MVPTISYLDYIKNAKNKVEARKNLQLLLREEQASATLNISETAQLWKCSRKTIRGILNKDNLDYESKKAPKSCPHKTDPGLIN